MFKEQQTRKLEISGNWCLEDNKNGKSEYFLATGVWKGGGVDELNEPRPSMQWRFDPDHPPANSDPATSCNLVIVGIVMMTMMVKTVAMMMNWWWWWTVWSSTRQPLGGTTQQKIMTSWLWAFWCTRGVINACLDGFQKAPRLANYFLVQSLSQWPCWILFEMLKFNSHKRSKSHATLTDLNVFSNNAYLRKIWMWISQWNWLE